MTAIDQASASSATKRRACYQLAIIVHPLFVHTLAEAPRCVTELTWRQLPPEVLRLVSTRLEAADLLQLAATCRELRVLARDEAVWRQLCMRKFSVPRRPHPPPSWRELYKFNHRLFVRIFSERGSQDAGPLINLQDPILLQA